MMVVENLLDVKSYFAGEVKENYLVQYEKMAKSSAFFEADSWHELEEETAECVKVLCQTGDACSVKRVMEYPVNADLDAVLDKIRHAHRDIFKG